MISISTCIGQYPKNFATFNTIKQKIMPNRKQVNLSYRSAMFFAGAGSSLEIKIFTSWSGSSSSDSWWISWVLLSVLGRSQMFIFCMFAMCVYSLEEFKTSKELESIGGVFMFRFLFFVFYLCSAMRSLQQTFRKKRILARCDELLRPALNFSSSLGVFFLLVVLSLIIFSTTIISHRQN